MMPLGALTVVAVAPWLIIRGVALYPSNGFWMGTVGFSLLYLGCGGVIMGAVALPTRIWDNAVSRSLSWVGFYSYSIYLWHSFVGGLVIRRLAGLHMGSYPHFSIIAYSMLTVLVGYLAAKAVEMPMLSLRDRLFPRKA